MRRPIVWRDRGYLVDDDHVPGQPDWWTTAPDGWEPDLFDAIDRYVGPGVSVLDIGAWIGPVTLYCAAGGNAVYAVEPDPIAHRLLSNNVALNDFRPKPHVMECAVGFEDGPLWLGPMQRLGDSQTSIYSTRNTFSVSSYALPSLVALHGVGPPYFVKLDVEGAEPGIISGAFHWFVEHGPTLHISVHPAIVPVEGGYNWLPIDALAALYPYVYDHEGQRVDVPSRHARPSAFLLAQEPLHDD